MHAAVLAAALLLAPPAAAEQLTGALPNGATWVIDTPRNWNGALLLYSHGYAMGPANPARNAPDAETRQALLDRGYALAGSSYRTTGWAIEEAVPDQLATLETFATRVARPTRVLAWGESMGGLVTIALAERHGDRLDGAFALCGSVSGAVPMMNMALDGAFAIKTLLAPELDIVDVADDRALARQATAVVERAMETPPGRARLALAVTLAQLPPWSDAKAPRPAADDYDHQLRQMGKAAVMGIFFPRSDQERRAGGVFSWNTGVNYARQLERSGRSSFVEHHYRRAGLNLGADLKRLAAAPRIAADPQAVDYLRRNYSPTGRIADPVLTLHNTDDAMTMVTKEAALAKLVRDAGKSTLLRQLYVGRAGHCDFAPGELVASVQALDHRVTTGRWGDLSPRALNARANGPGHPPAFVSFQPAAFLRP